MRAVPVSTTTSPGNAFDLHSNARELVANLLITKDWQVWAGYRLRPQRWNFLGHDLLTQLLDGTADTWAACVNDAVPVRPFLERSTFQPYPVKKWMGNLDARTPNPAGKVDAPLGEESWNALMARQQQRVSTAGMDKKATVRYFHLGTLDARISVAENLKLAKSGEARVPDEIRDIIRAEKQMRDVVAGKGWQAVPLTEREQRWTRARSWAPGIIVPNVLDGPADLAQLSTENWNLRWAEDEDDRFTWVTAFRGGKKYRRAVQVLTVTGLSPMAYPESGLEPWQVYSERVTDADGRAFPVEWEINGALFMGRELSNRANYDLRKAIALKNGYAEWDELPPEKIQRGIDRALQVRDEVSTGRARDSVRFIGSVNCIIWAEDEFVLDEVGKPTEKVLRPAADILEERSEALIRLMGGNDLQMVLAVPEGQAAKLREGVAGEPVVRRAFQRQFDLHYLTAGMPNVSATVGDDAGPYDGYTRGATRRPVMHDTHYSTEGRGTLGRKANLWLWVASLGGGKTIGMGKHCYLDVRRGIPAVYNDPSGGVARMVDLLNGECGPGTAVEWNIAKATPGQLNPPSLIRTPARGEFLTPDGKRDPLAYRRAVTAAKKERRALINDLLWMPMPDDVRRIDGARGVLRTTIKQFEWEETSDLHPLMNELRMLGNEGDRAAKAVADVLFDMAEDEHLRAFFADAGEGGDFRVETIARPLLTVITTPGIKRATAGTEREEWNDSETAAAPLLHAAGLLTSRVLYDKPMTAPVSGYFDEADNLKDSGSSRAMMNRLGRDHSKWNQNIEIGSQNLDGAMVGDLRNFVAGYYVGLMRNRAHAEQMLDEIRIQDRSYASTLMGLSATAPGEFVHLDADGRVEAMRMDLEDVPQLKETLFTNPGTDTADLWFNDEELA